MLTKEGVTFEGNGTEGDSDHTSVILHMWHTEPNQISIGHLDEISVIRQASSLYLLLQLLDEFLI